MSQVSRCLRLTENVDLGVSGPVDGVTIGLTAVSSLILEVQVLQVEQGQSVLLLRPLEDSLVLVCPPPGDGRRIKTSGGSTGQDQT